MGKICNVANLTPGGRSATLQIFRGKVCNVADLPGGGGEVCKGEDLQYNTGTYIVVILLETELFWRRVEGTNRTYFDSPLLFITVLK